MLPTLSPTSPAGKAALLIGLLALTTAALLWLNPDSQQNRVMQHGWDLGHILIFFLLTITFVKSQQQSFKPLQAVTLLLATTAFAILYGLLTELLQILVERNFSYWDIARNWLGTQLGCLYCIFNSNALTKRLRIYAAIVLLALLIAMLPLTTTLLDRLIARQQFPILANFETPLEQLRWQADGNIAIKTFDDDTKILRVQLNHQSYPGISLNDFPNNWLAYNSINIRLFNPGQAPLTLTIRLHDKAHKRSGWRYNDRFNQTNIFQPGWTTLQIPLQKIQHAPKNRQLDLDEMRHLKIFSPLSAPSTVFYLDSIYLK